MLIIISFFLLNLFSKSELNDIMSSEIKLIVIHISIIFFKNMINLICYEQQFLMNKRSHLKLKII